MLPTAEGPTTLEQMSLFQSNNLQARRTKGFQKTKPDWRSCDTQAPKTTAGSRRHHEPYQAPHKHFYQCIMGTSGKKHQGVFLNLFLLCRGVHVQMCSPLKDATFCKLECLKGIFKKDTKIQIKYIQRIIYFLKCERGVGVLCVFANIHNL